jgi:hypothetical protein
MIDTFIIDVIVYIIAAIFYFIYVISYNPLLYAVCYFIPIMIILYGVKQWLRRQG